MITLNQQEEALFNLCKTGDIGAVSRLVESGVNVNKKDAYNRTPLHIASQHGHEDLVYYLVKHGADVYAVDGEGFVPCRVAFNNGYIDIANYLAGVEDRLLSVDQSDVVVQVVPQQKSVSQLQTKKLTKKERKQQNQPIAKVKSKKLTRKEKKQKNQSAQSVQKQVILSQQNVVAQAPQQQLVNQVQNQNFDRQSNNVQITRTDNSIHIYEFNTPDHYTEIILFRDCDNCLAPGVYYRTSHGLNRVNGPLTSSNGVIMYNPLLNLRFMEHVLSKIHGDKRHSFSQNVEAEGGSWARIVIKNAIDDTDQVLNGVKNFKILVTIPGEIREIDNSTGQAIVINRLSGVFEFVIRKNLYKVQGECFHRFFAPKGMVGAENFGAKAQNKVANQ